MDVDTAIVQNPDPTDALVILAGHGKALVNYLGGVIGPQAAAPPRLLEAIQYSLYGGGKRLRPALVLESALAIHGRRDAPLPVAALAAAAAIELMHTFSLVHDDLPAMDNDDLRRGRPTNHKVFGEAMAILAGDAMVTMAFGVLARDCPPATCVALVGELAAAAGPEGMIGGQVLDMQAEGRKLEVEGLRRLHAMKTGAMLRSACRMGAMAAGAGAGAAALAAVSEYGSHLGLAFQIVDDLLDVTATPQQVGKATGKDAIRGKNTYPVLLGVTESRRQAREQLTAALEALRPLGEAATGLRTLAEFVVERDT